MKASVFILSILMTSSAWAQKICKSDAIYIYNMYHWAYTSEIILSNKEITDDPRRSDLRDAVIAKSASKDQYTEDNRDTLLTWIANAKPKKQMPENLGADIASFLKETSETISHLQMQKGPAELSGKIRLDILNGEGRIEAKEYTFTVADERFHDGYNQIKIEGACTEDLYNNLRPLLKQANKSRPFFEPLRDILSRSIIIQMIQQM